MKIKSGFIAILIILCIFLTLTCVSANDNQTEILTDSGSYQSFSELNRSISESGDEINLTSNYMFDNSQGDKAILINKTKFVINGNDHVIDGNNNVTLFNYANGEVIFNNLTLMNGKDGFLNGGHASFTFNNVKFISKTNASSFFVMVFYSNITFNNCSFSSFTENFGDMAAVNSNVRIENSIFSKIGAGEGTQIYVDRGALTVINTTFINSSSYFGGAINYKGHSLTIKRSKFLNSHVTQTGGAILAKFFPNEKNGTYIPPNDMIVEDCIFYNASAKHNGGAIYVDVDSGSNDLVQTVDIFNCTFINCSSEFGGALVHMGGSLNVADSRFINNSAGQFGGAIYVTWVHTNITNSIFTDNHAKHNAGALYFDNGFLKIYDSNFTHNKVTLPSSKSAIIYAFDVDAHVCNSTFDNGGIAIYADFPINCEVVNVTSSDLFLMNNTEYIVFVENKGIKFNLTENSITVENLPTKFDMRDWGWVGQVKNQGDNPSCWAFAAASAIESAIIKNTGIDYDLSEDNIQNLQLRYFRTGDLRNVGTGFAYSALGYALSWYGPVMASDDPYDERGMISDISETENRIHVQDAMFIFGGRNDTSDLIKRAIIKYGSVTIHHHPLDPMVNNYVYIDNEEQPTHFVHITGWDDTIPAEKFARNTSDNKTVVPPGPGGWIAKNFLGPEAFDEGYFYISYHDKTILANDYLAVVPQNAAIVYIFENDIDYHVNYQTDLTGLVGFDEDNLYYSNEFTSQYDELIGAVGTYFNESGINYSLDVYVNGKLVHSQNGISEFAGFRTIVLNKYIPIKTGEKFKVVFKSNSVPYQEYSRHHYIEGMTFVGSDGKTWQDYTLQDRTVCLKVYTVADDTRIIDNTDIAVDYSGGSYFSVRVVTADGRAVGEGALVKFTLNGKTTTVKTDSNGIAKIMIGELPKKYTLTTTYNAKTYKNMVTVKQVLTASKVTVKKKTAKKFYIKAKLKINGKLIKGKVIKFKFKGKTYKAKTNKKGIAQVTIKKNVIKKLKKGKKYTVKITYLKDTIKTTVNVK
ncbi:C1 family peptidase [Methanobrevibacter sp.]